MNADQRKHLKDLAQYLVDYEPQVNYPLHDVRGAKDAATFRLSEAGMKSKLKLGGHLMMDCSQGVTCLYKWAGLDDPNGLDYAYAGFTGTLLRHLRHYSEASRARTGALVVYGPGTGDHVSMVMDHGTNPLLWSHGFDGGPQLIRLSVQSRFHRPPVTFLNVSSIGSV